MRTRTVGSAVYNMLCQTGSIISSNVCFVIPRDILLYRWLVLCLTYLLFQIYRTDDKPYYRKGNKILLALVGWNVLVTIFIKLYYMRRNKKREQLWNAMSPDQKQHYLRTTKDEGNKKLDFRFAH